MTATLGSTTKAMVATEPTIRSWRWPWIHLLQPSHFVVRELALAMGNLPDGLEGLRIVVLSDLHLTPKWHSAYDRVIETVAALRADLVLITGDIVDDRRTHVPAMPVVSKLLPALSSRLGSTAILGNHDNLRLAKELEQLGVQVLNGERTLLDTGNGFLELIGAPGPKRTKLKDDFVQQFGPPDPHSPRIVMAHFPDHFPKLQVLRPDIYLCGHTHAGQVCLPGGIMLVRHDSSSPKLCRGYHRIGPTHYIVNQGLGFSGLAIRAFCPPEILLLRLTRA